MLDGITVLGKKLCNFNKTVLAGIFIILGGNFEFWKNIANSIKILVILFSEGNASVFYIKRKKWIWVKVDAQGAFAPCASPLRVRKGRRALKNATF